MDVEKIARVEALPGLGIRVDQAAVRRYLFD